MKFYIYRILVLFILGLLVVEYGWTSEAQNQPITIYGIAPMQNGKPMSKEKLARIYCLHDYECVRLVKQWGYKEGMELYLRDWKRL